MKPAFSINKIIMMGLGFGLAFVLTGCGGGEPSAKATKAPPVWALHLTVDGSPVKLPLEVMDVYLVEDNAYAETFEFRGPGVTLAGEFPLTIHVDYGEDWEVLKGQTIPISATGGDRSAPVQSSIELPGLGSAQVTGGSFKVDTIGGQWAGSEGDITLSGKIQIEIKTASGPKTISGTFAAHGVTWG